MSRYAMPRVSEMFQQRRTARDLVAEMDMGNPGFPRFSGSFGGTTNISNSLLPPPNSRRADPVATLLGEYARAGETLGRVNAFLEQNFQAGTNVGPTLEEQMSAPTPKYEVGKGLPEPPAYFDAEGRREWWRIMADATRAERQGLALPSSQFTNTPRSSPGSMEPTRSQPSETTGYYTNETGTFYHLEEGDRYYDG